MNIELLVLASVFLMGFVWGWCGCYRMCLKNERQGVYSEPEGVDPCVGKGEHVMDAYGMMMTDAEIDAIELERHRQAHEFCKGMRPLTLGEPSTGDIKDEGFGKCDFKQWADHLVNEGKTTAGYRKTKFGTFAVPTKLVLTPDARIGTMRGFNKEEK
jgi:hypothetical protein